MLLRQMYSLCLVIFVLSQCVFHTLHLYYSVAMVMICTCTCHLHSYNCTPDINVFSKSESLMDGFFFLFFQDWQLLQLLLLLLCVFLPSGNLHHPVNRHTPLGQQVSVMYVLFFNKNFSFPDGFFKSKYVGITFMVFKHILEIIC